MGKWFRLKEEQFERFEKHFEKHGGKTLLFGKSQPYGSIFLTAAGIGKMPYLKFIWINIFGSSIKIAILLAVGFYFGQAYLAIDHYINYIGFILTALAGFVIISYLLYKKWKKSQL